MEFDSFKDSAAETERIVLDRLSTFDQDKKAAVDAHLAVASIRRKLEQPVAR